MTKIVMKIVKQPRKPLKLQSIHLSKNQPKKSLKLSLRRIPRMRPSQLKIKLKKILKNKRRKQRKNKRQLND